MPRRAVCSAGLASLALALSSSAFPEDFDCLIEPYLVVNVSSSIEGLLDEVFVERGDLVTKDQIIAQLESEVEKATVELARAKATASAAIDLRRVRLDFSSQKETRGDEMYRKKFIALSEKDELETDRTLASLELREAVENKRIAGLELKRAVALLEQRAIPSPLTGVVVERLHSPGEYVENDAIFKLAQLDPLNVEVLLPVTMFGAIKVGMLADIIPEAPVGGTYSAKVKIVDKVIDGASATFGVRLELPNPEYRLAAGLKCRTRFAD